LTALTTGLVSGGGIVKGSKQERLIQEQLQKIKGMKSFEGKTNEEIEAILKEL